MKILKDFALTSKARKLIENNPRCIKTSCLCEEEDCFNCKYYTKNMIIENILKKRNLFRLYEGMCIKTPSGNEYNCFGVCRDCRKNLFKSYELLVGKNDKITVL